MRGVFRIALVFSFVLQFVFSTMHLAAQPEQNCNAAIPVCQQSYTQNQSYSGSGSISDVFSGQTCLGSGETNSVWYIFTVQNSGSFGFGIQTNVDYDYALWNVSANGCGDVGGNPIRCNYSADYGLTGLDPSNTPGGNLSYSASQPPFMPGIQVTTGQTFVLLINNFTGSDDGYTVTFTGSAQIFDQIPPTFTITQPPCTIGAPIILHASEPIDCSQLNNSSFSIAGTGATVTSVTGLDCGQWTYDIQVNYTISGTPSGNYTITPNNIFDLCDNEMIGSAQFQFPGQPTIPPPSPICTGESITLTSSIAGTWSTGQTGTSITVSPTQTTTYSVSVGTPPCQATATATVAVTQTPFVGIAPNNVVICDGSNATLSAVATPGATLSWSGPGVTGNSSSSVSVGTGTYTVTATVPPGCEDSATATVLANPPANAPACVNLFVSPTGTGAGETSDDPASLLTALGAAACASTVIKMQVGNYTIDAPINITSGVTLEGGFLADWSKTSTTGLPTNTTIITRSAVGSYPYDGIATAPALICVNLNGVSNFRLQDITFATVNAPAATAANPIGVSTYAIRMVGCSAYNVVRCRTLPGNASPGLAGTVGASGTAGGAGANGGIGSNTIIGGVGGTSQLGNTGGAGGNGGAAGSNSGIAGQAGLNPGGAGGAGGNSYSSFDDGFGSDENNAGSNGANGVPGAVGTAGSTGSLGVAGYSAGYFVPGTGSAGTSGGAGKGGGGGGGGVFGILVSANSGGNITDCQFIGGTIGTSGTGGAGGSGGTGGAGGIGANVYDGGTGGNGGAGGAGGSGGAGGNGSPGLSQNIYVDGGGGPTQTNVAFNLTGQPVITYNGVACINQDADFTGPNSAAWNFGSGASPTTANGAAVTTQYSNIGRKDIVFGANTYTGFVNIVLDQSIEADISTSAPPVPLVPDTYQICEGESATFDAVTQGAGYEWDINGDGNADATGSSYTPSVNVAGSPYTIEHRVRTDCCGWSNWVQVVLNVEPIPNITMPAGTAVCGATGSTQLVAIVNNPAAVDPATYLWTPATGLDNPNSLTPTVSGIGTPITYTFTAYNYAGNCDFTGTVTVDIADLEFSLSETPANCGDNGALAVTGLTGTGPYTYSWTPNVGAGATVSNLAIGAYTVTVTDNGTGCEQTESANVSVNNGFFAVISDVNKLCNNSSTVAEVTVSFFNGSGPYSISWSGAATGSATAPAGASDYLITGLIDGNYNITVTAQGGCDFSQALEITPNPPITASISGTDAACGGTDGLATVSASGGTPPFYYFWDHDPTIAVNPDPSIATNLAAGDYTVTVSDQAGCSVPLTVTIGETAAITTTFGTIPNICQDDTAPSLPSTSTNTPPLTGNWSPATINTSNAGAAIYTFTPDDPCASAYELSVTIDPLLTPTFNLPTEFCEGETATTLPNSSDNGVNGTWSPASVSNTASGTYLFTPGNGQCSEPYTLDVIVNPLPQITVDSGCNGNTDGDGEITVDATVIGNLPLEYSLDNGAYQSSNIFSNVGNGAYTISVRVVGQDCPATASVNINCNCVQPTLTIQNPSPICENTTGDATQDIEASVIDTDGTNIQFYSSQSLANQGGNGDILDPSNVQAGVYYIRVEVSGDADCFTIEPVEVVINPLPVATISDPGPICSGDPISLTASGGISFQWSNGGGTNATANFNNLTTNTTITVDVTDVNDCTAQASYEVVVNPIPTISLSSDCGPNPSNGTGEVTITASTPGNDTFEYSSNGFSFQNSNVFNNLDNGDYTFYVQIVGTLCGASSDISINCSCEQPILTLQPLDPICNNANGDATMDLYDAIITNTGDIPVFYTSQILADAGGVSDVLTPSAVANGTYYIRSNNPTDATCYVVESIEVVINDLPIVAIEPVSAICSGEDITLTASGGPSYSWSNGGGSGSTATYTNLTSDQSYTVNVTDGNGCEGSDDITVTVNALPSLSLAFDCGANPSDGTGVITATASVTGGGALEYALDNGAYQSSNVFSNLSNGNYTITVRVVGENCTTEESITVNCSCVLPTLEVTDPSPICENTAGNATVDLSTAILNNTGTTPQYYTTQALANAGGAGNVPNPSAVQAGTYYVRINNLTDPTCFAIEAVEVVINELPIVSIAPVSAICAGDDITLTASGGPSYSWSNGGGSGTTATYTDLTSDQSYTVNVTDGNGCEGSDDITVTVNALPSLSLAFDCGANPSDGTGVITATASVTGGGALEYALDNGAYQSSNVFSNLSNGNYTITVRVVGENCTTEESITVNCSCVLPTLEVTDPSPICENTAGNATVDLSTAILNNTGTTPQYYTTQALANAGGAGNVSNPSAVQAGTYYVRINNLTDPTCFAIEAVEVVINELPIVSIAPVNAICAGDDITLTASGGPSYSWSNGGGSGTTATYTNLTSDQSYTVNVTDGNGCEGSDDITVTVNSLPSLSLAFDCGANPSDGTGVITATASVTGGGALEYALDNGAYQSSNVFSNLSNGNYTITVRVVGENCTTEESITVNCSCVLPTLDVTDPSPICDNTAGNATVDLSTAILNNTGTTPQYYTTQALANAGGAGNVPNPSAVQAGTYYVRVNDDADASCFAIEPILVIINDLPIVAIEPVNAICAGEDITLTASGGPSYSWSNGGGSGTTATYTNLTSDQSYTVNVIDGNGCEGSDDITVTVNALPSLSLAFDCGANPSDGTGEITATASVAGGGALEYALDNGAYQSSNVFSNLSNGNYTITVRVVGENCTTEESITVNCSCVLPTLDVSDPSPICDNTAGNATVDLSTAILNNTGTTPQYYTTQALANAGGAGNVPNPSAVLAGTYYVRVNDAADASCFAIEPILVIINDLPIVAIEPVNAICAGEDITLTASGGPSYSWSNGGGSGTTATYTNLNSDQTYTVNVTDGNGCEGSDDITVTVNALPSLSLAFDCGANPSNGTGEITATASVAGGGTLEYALDNGAYQSSNVFSDLSNGNYTITVRVVGENCTTEESITVNCSCVLPTLDVTDPSPICENTAGNATVDLGTAILNNTGTTPQYYTTQALANAGGAGNVPNPSAVQAGTYYVRVNDAADASCFAIEPIEVVINELPEISISSSCIGATADVAITVLNGTGLEFSLDSGSLQTDLLYQNVQNGNHEIVVTDENGCMSETPFVVACDTDCPTSTFLPQPLALLCDGDIPSLPQLAIDIIIQDPNNTMVENSFGWYMGNNPDTDAAFINGPQAVIDDCAANEIQTIYAFIQCNDNGIENWIQVAEYSFQVYPPVQSPSIAIIDDLCNYTITPHCEEDILDPSTLVTQLPGTPAGDITIEVTSGIENNPCGPQNFVLQFPACPIDELEVWIPTAFSPNGDNVNDEFRILGKGIVSGELHIYNRWGDKVFATTDILSGWNGTFNGGPAEVEVYVFWANVNLSNGEKQFYQGNLTLVR